MATRINPKTKQLESYDPNNSRGGNSTPAPTPTPTPIPKADVSEVPDLSTLIGRLKAANVVPGTLGPGTGLLSEQLKQAYAGNLSPEQVAIQQRNEKMNAAAANEAISAGAVADITNTLTPQFTGQEAVNQATSAAGSGLAKIGSEAMGQTPLLTPLLNQLPQTGLENNQVVNAARGGLAVAGAAIAAAAVAPLLASVGAVTTTVATHSSKFLAGAFVGGSATNAVKDLISGGSAKEVFKTAEADLANLVGAVKAGTVTPEEAVTIYNGIQDYVNEETRGVKTAVANNPILWIDGGDELMMRAAKTQREMQFQKEIIIKTIAQRVALGG